MKTINVDSHNVPATARSKNYQTALATTASSGGGATTPPAVTPTGGVADTAKVAQNLAEDSTDWAKILRKDINERTENALSIGKNLTVEGQAILNDVVANKGTFSGMLKAASATITGALSASTVSATTMNANTFIGDLTGNAATATKLKTPRTIWGQSFDGSGNVNGVLYINNGIIRGEGTQSLDGIPCHGVIMGHNAYNQWDFGEYGGQYNFYLSTLTTNANLIARIDTNNNYLSGSLGIGTTSPACKLDVNGNMRVTSDLYADATVGTRNFASHTTGWRADANGNADFRNIYADELRVQAFTADISQALAGSDYLTKSVSKLSANFVVPSVNSTVRIIVDDIEGMPATQCFANNDYIRFRAFNRTSGLTIANVWGTVTLDTTFGTNGFLNGTQAYTFTCTQTTGAGLTVFKGSEVLDYGISGSGLIARTTLDTMGSPYEQIATWANDPSNGNNYTVHARLGNLNGIANCSGYGLYTDNGFFTGKITVGDLTKTNHYLDFSNGKLTVKGDVYLSNGDGVVGSNGVISAINLTRETAIIQASKINLNGAVTIGAIDKSSVTPEALGAATPTGVTTAVNGIQVGGRNLARNSKGNFTYNMTDVSNYTGYMCIAYWVGNKNTNIVISGDVEYSNVVFTGTGSGYFHIQGAQDIGQWNDSLGINLIDKIHSGNGSFHFSFALTEPSTLNNNFWNFGFRSDYITGTITFRNLKVEYGTKETSWTPAPEDVDANIATAQSTADAAATAASNAQSAVDNIQIGGRNLIIYSRLISGWINNIDGTIASDPLSMCDPNFYACSGNQSFAASVHSNPTPKGGGIYLVFYDSNKNYLSNVRTFYNGNVYTPIFTSPESARYYRYATCYKENVCKIEVGNKATDWSPAPEDVAQDAQNKVDALSRAHGGYTFLDDHSIYTGTLTAKQVNAVGIDAGSITVGTLNADRIGTNAITADKIAANTITGDRINANSVSAAIANVISLDAGRIKTGILSADRIDVVNVVTKGLSAQTIDAQSATISNLNVVNATVSGAITASVIGYNASTVNNGLVNGCLLVGGGNYILPTLPRGKCVEYTLFHPMITPTTIFARISGQGQYDRFMEASDQSTDYNTDRITLVGYHKFIGIGDTAPNGGTLWVYN